ncbi:oxidoreductase [Clostridium baratii]|uniref:oxidoreductase n=1 Tax=Clostridium baratii TaxID=1561 RepID=UPI001C23E16D|nr:oxidoreductase [Clostridium baratii]
MKKLKIGIIGFGKSANRYHLPYILNKEKFEVVKIFSRTEKKELEEKYNKYGIKFVRDVNELLNDNTIDLVTVCTHVDSHYEYAKLALNNNKHVLIEKPFTRTSKECKELYEIAREKNLIIMPYQNRRYDSDFLALKNVIESNVLGDLVELESHFDYYRKDLVKIDGSPYDGAFYGLGVHTIDQIVSIFGKPDKVTYDIRSIRVKGNPDDYYEVCMFYDNFKAIVKTNHLVKIEYPKFILHGFNGSFIKCGIDKQEECLKANIMPWDKEFKSDIKENYGKLNYIDNEGNDITKVIETPKGDYSEIYNAMYDAIINNKELPVKEEEVLEVMNILNNGIKECYKI